MCHENVQQAPDAPAALSEEKGSAKKSRIAKWLADPAQMDGYRRQEIQWTRFGIRRPRQGKAMSIIGTIHPNQAGIL